MHRIPCLIALAAFLFATDLLAGIWEQMCCHPTRIWSIASPSNVGNIYPTFEGEKNPSGYGITKTVAQYQQRAGKEKSMHAPNLADITSDLNDITSDESLIDAIVSGDIIAMETLYKRYSRPFFSLAYRMTASKQVSEDLVQAAFLLIWRNRTAYSGETGSVRQWLFSIMHYRIIDYLRHRRFRSAWKEIPWEDVEHALSIFMPDPWEETWRLEQSALIHEALQNLPCEQRKVIELAYFEGLTHDEIAKHCHIPLGTAKSRLRLGLHRLKRTLIEQGIDKT